MRGKDYQQFTKQTAIYPREKALEYCVLGLVGEAGEIANKVKKIIRDYEGQVSEDMKKDLSKEYGDVLWYIARGLDELGFDMGEIMKENIDKLLDRKKRGVIGGSGDDR